MPAQARLDRWSRVYVGSTWMEKLQTVWRGFAARMRTEHSPAACWAELHPPACKRHAQRNSQESWEGSSLVGPKNPASPLAGSQGARQNPTTATMHHCLPAYKNRDVATPCNARHHAIWGVAAAKPVRAGRAIAPTPTEAGVHIDKHHAPATRQILAQERRRKQKPGVIASRPVDCQTLTDTKQNNVF